MDLRMCRISIIAEEEAIRRTIFHSLIYIEEEIALRTFANFDFCFLFFFTAFPHEEVSNALKA